MDDRMEQIIDALEYRVAQLEDLVMDNIAKIEKTLLLAHGIAVRPPVDRDNERHDLNHRRKAYYKVINQATTDA